MRSRRGPVLLAASGIAVLAVIAGACGNGEGAGGTDTTAAFAQGPRLENAWVVDQGDDGAAYLLIRGGPAEDALVGASVSPDVAASVEIVGPGGDAGGDTGAGMTGDGQATAGPTVGSPGGDDEGVPTTMGGSFGGSNEPTSGSGASVPPTSIDPTADGDRGAAMETARLDRLPIPADRNVELRPGGEHLRLVGLREPLRSGQRITITLEFEIEGRRTVEAEVREA
jgi:copper(I)-binding protein